MSVETILVPTDGSEGAMAGARRAIELCDVVGAGLHVLSVVDTNQLEPEVTAAAAGPENPREVLHGHAERSAEEIAERARSRLPGDVWVAVEEGSPVETINEYVTAHAIDLIAMGTRGRTGLERVVLGSVAEKTLRSSRVPVMTVGPDAAIDSIGATSYDEILVPTDGSDPAERAVAWGVDLAAALDARIHTVYSVDTRRFGHVEGAPAMHEALEQAGRAALESVRERAREADVGVEASLATGPAAGIVLDYAAEHDIDLLTMGTHGRSGVSRYLIGSVTETVVRRAPVPVCSVPIPASE